MLGMRAASPNSTLAQTEDPISWMTGSPSVVRPKLPRTAFVSQNPVLDDQGLVEAELD